MSFLEALAEVAPEVVDPVKKAVGVRDPPCEPFLVNKSRLKVMAKQSSQKFIARNRAPRVQIEYEVEVYGSEKKIEIPIRHGRHERLEW